MTQKALTRPQVPSIRRRGSMLVLAMALAACSSTATTTLVDAQTADDLIHNEEGLVVIDIRTPEETAVGTLPNAIELDFYSDSFRSELDALDRTVPYLVYCRSGNRSAEAVSAMADLGFERVYELRGGIVTWVDAGLSLSAG